MSKSKGSIPTLVKRTARSEKPAKTRRAVGPTMCERCGAVSSGGVWRRDGRVTDALLARAAWTMCPTCRQERQSLYFGRVQLRGSYATAHEVAIRRRILTVAEEARHAEPERRVIAFDRGPDALEVLTTSQKLAHRVAHEIQKTFGGRTSYRWSERDGSLLAVWEHARPTRTA